MEELTHWKQTRNAEYLGAYDLIVDETKEGKPIYKEERATIEKIVVDEMVIDPKSSKNEKKPMTVAYFKDKGIKKMILNSTNKTAIEEATGTPFVENWAGKTICIFVKPVRKPGTSAAENKMVDALRIKPVPKRMCSVCGTEISEEFYQASMKKYGKALCSAKCKEEAGIK